MYINCDGWGSIMYAIRNKRTKKWLFGTDYRYSPSHQRTSENRAIVFEDYDHAKAEFRHRECGKAYEIVPVKLLEITGLKETERKEE